MNIENKYTFRQSLTQGVNLFLGSGFSILDKDAESRQLPTGTVLAYELAERFQIPDASEQTLTQISTIVEEKIFGGRI